MGSGYFSRLEKGKKTRYEAMKNGICDTCKKPKEKGRLKKLCCKKCYLKSYMMSKEKSYGRTNNNRL